MRTSSPLVINSDQNHSDSTSSTDSFQTDYEDPTSQILIEREEDINSTSIPCKTQATQAELNQLLTQINLRWGTLIRSNDSISNLVKDTKIRNPKGIYRIYVNTNVNGSESLIEIEDRLKRSNPLGDMDQIEVLELNIDNYQKIFKKDLHGTLYLPYPYVVPGGVFQEMYAWDSFFIALGLIRDKEIRLARNILDNYIYQIEHYGKILNGNRTYYLNRSQLPFLTPLIKLIYPTVSSNHSDFWLRKAIKASEKYYDYWTTGHHFVKQTGLSRFFDSSESGSIPPEIIHETDQNGFTAYDRVKKYFKENYETGIPDYDIKDYYDPITNTLKPKFMDNDRAMRESGFDTSCRFGPFNSKILDYNPICLNSLLVLMEKDISDLYRILLENLESKVNTLLQNNPHHHHRQNTKMRKYAKLIEIWKSKSIERIKLIKKFNWDENDQFFYDYDFINLKKNKSKIYSTSFFPIWCNIVNDKQEINQIIKRGLNELETNGGILTSNFEFGDQWDKPYGWGPLQLIVIESLYKYNYNEDANRLSIKFLSLILKVWLKTDQIWEKYNLIKRNEIVNLKFGYDTNEIGFGWTNAVFTRLYDYLPIEERKKILYLDGISINDENQINNHQILSQSWIKSVNQLNLEQKTELMKLIVGGEEGTRIGTGNGTDSDDEWVKVSKE
ncbi:hypothetical protein CROQUDRAFT_43855 [Cronartium quercuum f. sp. fusiforme G11]|uniref:Trehalase n=1 Tax=Cronartium quercuum f. sp. fusiforme G11 TaxID=708437 RepID=A0A9P6NGX1_9BASI|nr:hypothetical protein CROQUDRAFT_43855 [Cronartium quercuum f. sp. fusiforme G11]